MADRTSAEIMGNIINLLDAAGVGSKIIQQVALQFLNYDFNFYQAEVDDLLEKPPFILSNEEKEKLLLPALQEAFMHHNENSLIFKDYCAKKKFEPEKTNPKAAPSVLTTKSAVAFAILELFLPTVNALLSNVYLESTKWTSSPIVGDAGNVIVTAPPFVSTNNFAPAWTVSAAETVLHFLY